MNLRLFLRIRLGRKAAPRHADASGFTLIEVVMALAIFALMGGILYGAFSLGHSAVAKSDANATRSQKQRAIADLLGSYVRSGFPYRETAQSQAISFAGESDSLTFVSAYSQGMGGRGMAKITIAKEDDGKGQASLQLTETAPVRFGADGGQRHSIVLQANLREFRLAYLDPQAEDEKWEDRWDGSERGKLPRAVRFSYLDESGKEVRWTFPIMMSVLSQ
jgi:general secretion pathway protein J